MALISKTIANLVNGVSQQPPAIRNPTQCEAQENLLSDVNFGVVHRPPAEFLAKLDSLGADPAMPFFHTINRGVGNQYKVMITDGDLKVFDALTGEEKTVTFPDGKTYLDSSSPVSDFQCLTIGNRTYVLNKSVTVTQGGNRAITYARPTREALVFIKQGDYSTDYKVTLSATDVDLGPPAVTSNLGPWEITKTTHATDANDIKTSEIAADLKTGIEATGANTYLSVDTVGSVLWLVVIDPPANHTYDFKISLEDSKGNTNARLVRSQIQKFADLPTVAPLNYNVAVIGDKASGYDDYYVVFKTNDNSDFGSGYWEETFLDGTNRGPHDPTMPLVLEDNGDGTFTCEEEVWDYREAGDTVTNPNPPFIGTTIDQMFTSGNRLGFLFGGQVALSEVGVYTNFYLTTVTTFLDSDPIHMEELNGFDKWLYAVPLAEKVVLFSTKGQAVVSGAGGLLTPKTAQIDGSTRYPVSETCQPILVGDNIYFTSDSNRWSKVYEMFVSGNADNLAASEITSHVPQYLPKGLIRLTGAEDSKMLVAIGTSDTTVSNWNTVYIYKYFWHGDQKLQSSWSKWIFDPSLTVADATIIDGKLYVVLYDEDTGDLLYNTIDLDIAKVDPDNGALIRTHLDIRVDGSDCTLATEDSLQSITLPFEVHDDLKDSFKVYLKEDRVSDPPTLWGRELEIESWVDDSTIRIDREGLALAAIWIGIPYTSTFTLSEIHLKEDQNGSQVPTEIGKLSLRKIAFLFNNTLFARVEVTPQGRDTKTYELSPYIAGSPTTLLEAQAIDRLLTVPVNAKNTEVTISVINDSVVGHRLQTAEWTAQYSVHSQRAA